MDVDILSHNIEEGTATIKFEHNGIVYQDFFDLINIVPGSKNVFANLGIPFDETPQLRAIEKLTAMVLQNIEEGYITNSHELAAPPEE